MIKYRQFAVRTLMLAVPVFVILGVLSLFDFFRANLLFVWFCYVFFVAMTLFTGYYNLRSVNKPIFGTIYFGTSGLKLLLSFSIIFLYMHFFSPPKWVLIPFVLLFLIFKVFELVVLFRQVKD